MLTTRPSVNMLSMGTCRSGRRTTRAPTGGRRTRGARRRRRRPDGWTVLERRWRLRDVIRIRLAGRSRWREDVVEREDVQVVQPGERVRQEVGVPGRELGRPIVDHAEGARLTGRNGHHRR